MSAAVVFRRFRVALLLLAVCWLGLAVAWLFVVPYWWRGVAAGASLLVSVACAWSAREARLAAQRIERREGGVS